MCIEKSALASLTHSLVARVHKKRMCVISGFGRLALHLLWAEYLSQQL